MSQSSDSRQFPWWWCPPIAGRVALLTGMISCSAMCWYCSLSAPSLAPHLPFPLRCITGKTACREICSVYASETPWASPARNQPELLHSISYPDPVTARQSKKSVLLVLINCSQNLPKQGWRGHAKRLLILNALNQSVHDLNLNHACTTLVAGSI